MKVSCVALKERFKNDGFAIFIMKPIGDIDMELGGKKSFSLKGELDFISEGGKYTLDISLQNVDKKYGATYILNEIPHFEAVEINEETELDLLCEITTVGQANKITKLYPNFIQMIMEGREEEIDISLLKGIKDTRMNFIIREVKNRFKFFMIKQKFAEYKLTNAECKMLNLKYKSAENIDKALANTPYYALIECAERSFEKCDSLILKRYPELKKSSQRSEFLMLHVLKKNELTGSSRMSARVMAQNAKRIAPECVSIMKDVAISSELIHYDGKKNLISRMSTFVSECACSNFILNKLSRSHVLNIDYMKYTTDGKIKLTDTQTRFLKQFCESSISILGGYSGTGKTSTIEALIRLMEDNQITYTLLAPTGTASARLAEVTGRETSTIHRAIMGGSGICTQALIVDEWSFASIGLFNLLIKAIENPDIRIVFVGDDAQLPSIGCGCVLRDMMESGIIPTTILTEVFRYADGGVMQVCTDIRNGKEFLSDEDIQHFGNDYVFIESDDILIDVLSQYKSLVDKGIFIEDITVLSPRAIGEYGTFNLNAEIQSIINSPIKNKVTHSINVNRNEDIYTVSFRQGDYVMNTANDYKAVTLKMWEQLQEDKDLSLDDFKEEDFVTVFNGDKGRVVNCDDKKMVVKFGDDLIVYSKTKMRNLLLAYAITAHKMQGSQNPYIINITSTEHQRQLNRNLLYVASSRVTKKHIEIGNREAVNEAIRIVAENNRDTWLLELLKKGDIR